MPSARAWLYGAPDDEKGNVHGTGRACGAVLQVSLRQYSRFDCRKWPYTQVLIYISSIFFACTYVANYPSISVGVAMGGNSGVGNRNHYTEYLPSVCAFCGRGAWPRLAIEELC